MFTKTLFVIASAALAIASPIGPGGPACAPHPPKGPTLPVNGGPKELAQPPAGMRLKHIALGFGIQNYTCASAGADPVSTGALAMFYDVTPLFPGQGPKSLSTEAFNSLTSTALNTHAVPLNLNAGSVGASATNPFPADAPLELDGMDPIPFLGHHLFTSTGTPNFIIDNGATNLLATKDDSIPAPSTADAGPDGTGAVAWLLLGAGPGSTGDSSLVYRVLTSGGNSHGCKAAGVDSTSYAANYWFFG